MNCFVPHNHVCQNKSCGTVWHHDPHSLDALYRSDPATADEAHNRAHQCPKCGIRSSLGNKNLV